MLIGGFQSIDLEKSFIKTEKNFLELQCDVNGEFKNQLLTNNGRTATIYLLKDCIDFDDNDIILMPDYLCWSVLLAVKEANVKYDFYHINRDLSIDIESLKLKLNDNVKAIYLIQYFGVPYEKDLIDKLLEIKNDMNLILIEDITQTLLTRSVGRIGIGDYIVCSTRKWFPVTDGGLLASKGGEKFAEIELLDPYNEATFKQLLITIQREYFINDYKRDIHDYLEMEKNANGYRYEDLSIRGISDFSKNIMFSSNLYEISKKRIENYNFLYSKLSEIQDLEILSKPLDSDGEFVPFGLLLLVDNRDEFYEYLAKNRIIGEIQWILPYEYYEPGEDADYLSKHNIMIQCDQRYCLKDMNYVVDVVRKYYES